MNSTNIYLSNKYTQLYYRIIQKATNRITKSGHKHHIIPKSLGGKDTKDNLVKLTYREHYIVHLLLTKMTVGEHKKKMHLAFFCMNTLNKCGEKYKNSKFFDYAMKNFADMMCGENNPAKQSEARRKISLRDNSYMKTPEYRKILSDAHKGKQTGANNPSAKKVISPKGEIFDTMKVAAEHYNMPWTTLQYWIRKNKNGWNYYSPNSKM